MRLFRHQHYIVICILCAVKKSRWDDMRKSTQSNCQHWFNLHHNIRFWWLQRELWTDNNQRQQFGKQDLDVSNFSHSNQLTVIEEFNKHNSETNLHAQLYKTHTYLKHSSAITDYDIDQMVSMACRFVLPLCDDNCDGCYVCRYIGSPTLWKHIFFLLIFIKLRCLKAINRNLARDFAF